MIFNLLQLPLPDFSTDIHLLSDFFQKIVLAVLLGILIGVEREHQRVDKIIFAGIRSFSLASITGMLAGYISTFTSIAFLYLITGFIGSVTILFIYVKNVTYAQKGITSPIAFFVTYLLGVMVAYEHFLIAIVSAIILTLLLAEKKLLHSFATTLTQDEIKNTLQFLTIVFILYPIVPDIAIYNTIRLRTVILIVVLVASLSFASFLIIKWKGANLGIPLTGFLGGLVNSETTTGALSALSKEKEELQKACFAGITLSNATMLIRNLIIAYIADPSGRITLLMLPPQFALFTATILATATQRGSAKLKGDDLKITNPFALGPAIKFAIGFTLLAIAANLINNTAGDRALYIVAIGGLVSSASVTASMATLAANSAIPLTTAANIAVLAGIISTANKMILVRISGSKQLSRKVNKTFLFLMIIGFAALMLWIWTTKG
jgi:uncharacterized membrane protein (DUF4010 family)